MISGGENAPRNKNTKIPNNYCLVVRCCMWLQAEPVRVRCKAGCVTYRSGVGKTPWEEARLAHETHYPPMGASFLQLGLVASAHVTPLDINHAFASGFPPHATPCPSPD